MARGNVEIEIKIPLGEDLFFKLKEKLKEIAKLEKRLKQTDEYFTPPHRNFVAVKFPFEWLSIRKRGNKVILNYKHYYPENAEVTTHCDEFETEIKNPEALKKTFAELNLKKLITVDKEREVYVYKDEFEIALDVVKDLGYFVEIEALKDFGGVKAARNKLFEFAKSLGLDVSKRDLRGYPFLLMTKKGLIKR